MTTPTPASSRSSLQSPATISGAVDASTNQLTVTGTGGTPGRVVVANDQDAIAVTLASFPGSAAIAAQGAQADIFRQDSGAGENYVALTQYGLWVSVHSAIADGDLGPGDCVIWFDQTNGVGNTKLMVKGKSADGTVKTATILLA